MNVQFFISAQEITTIICYQNVVVFDSKQY
jgi:hypothetical protein